MTEYNSLDLGPRGQEIDDMANAYLDQSYDCPKVIDWLKSNKELVQPFLQRISELGPNDKTGAVTRLSGLLEQLL